MNERDWSLDAEERPRPLILARRLWRALRIIGHLIAGVAEAAWRRAARDPHRPEILLAKQRWCLRLLAIMGVELRVHGALRGGPVFLVANHVSWLDIPVIAAARPCHFLSKAEVARWPVIGWLARSVGTLFIRRGAGESRAKAGEIREHLALGRGILVFPEGTTTDGTAVRRFFPRLFAAAEDAPVQTVAVRYRDAAGQVDRSLAFIDDDELHHHLWRLLGRERIVVDLTFGPPVPAAEPRERARLAREQIIASLG
ncbi:1-acyl-sn-glycerol-3-phosphate acyltransferase [Alcanivorax sp. 521-1]|uniref:1-acyl-sn-glycerol-3-phosphate acyltransferase n=1 Tax=Alloalcanivorax profundimaris TaxID=2735259 RepID=A0ABS0AUS5_9GAMM|nr:lysophospholipid acyltransferase family protein [Alloalcanivorax profundimaris]MBF5057887.1 1-acyl-sn-glycerol-3-phosphate acyltransferase [Alloalcanivorax profundimaris]